MTISNIQQAKNLVLALKGQSVMLRCNQGRNKIAVYNGVVTETHSNIFVVSIIGGIMDRLSCSYSDIICGDIHLKKK